MSDLIERYVHRVGRYLPSKERTEIEAELRSQIQDELDDRYGGTPSDEDIAKVLVELGDPRKMAVSYQRAQYLVGPDLYPYLMMALRYVWLIAPSIVIFLNVFSALVTPEVGSWVSLIMDTVFSAVQATLVFSAVVILFFAIVQRSGTEIQGTFNPLALPAIDDPSVVERVEALFGAALGAVMIVVMLYFLQAGGLTLPFPLNEPRDVIPVPRAWLILLLGAVLGMIVLNLLALRRSRWTAGTWLAETLLEVFGAICLYFVLYQPIFARVVASNLSLTDAPIPQIITIITAIITLLGRGNRQVKLWNYAKSAAPPFAIKAER
jgi:hypothetical protein